ncbi:MAG: hypothetical protein WBK91_10935 [Alphaproteobacteria bacterium]
MTETVYVKLDGNNAVAVREGVVDSKRKTHHTAQVFKDAGASVTYVPASLLNKDAPKDTILPHILQLKVKDSQYRRIIGAPGVTGVCISLRGLNP